MGTVCAPIRVDDIAARWGITIIGNPKYGVPGQCEWCGLAGAVADHRVHADPAPEHPQGIRLAEVCRDCASTVVAQALTERRAGSARRIWVEVAAG